MRGIAAISSSLFNGYCILYSVYTWLSPVEEDGQYWIQVGGGGCSGAQGLGDPVGRQVGPPTEPDQDGDTIVKYKLYS